MFKVNETWQKIVFTKTLMIDKGGKCRNLIFMKRRNNVIHLKEESEKPIRSIPHESLSLNSRGSNYRARKSL